jgi:lysophospholipase L1-like esterase
VLECAARAHSSVRYGNRHAWSYGWGFVQALHSGAIDEEQRTLTGNAKLETERAERTFLTRAEPLRDANDGFAAHAQAVVGEYGAHVNRLGLRGPEIAFDKPAGTTRIVALGGSFVFGWGVVDADTWTVRLEHKLRERAGPTEIVNGGRNGGTINRALTTLVRLAQRMPLDAVVLVSTYNNRNLLDVERRPTWGASVEYYLYNLSLLNVMLEEKISQLRREALDHQRFKTAVGVRVDALDEWRGLYRRRLDQIATVCREHGTRLFVGAEPQRFYDSRLDALPPGDDGETRRLTALVQDRRPLALSELEWYLHSVQVAELRRLDATGAATFLDTASAFMSDKRRWMIDQIHANRSGSERFAELVATELITRPPAGATR